MVNLNLMASHCMSWFCVMDYKNKIILICYYKHISYSVVNLLSHPGDIASLAQGSWVLLHCYCLIFHSTFYSKTIFLTLLFHLPFQFYKILKQKVTKIWWVHSYYVLLSLGIFIQSDLWDTYLNDTYSYIS